MMQENKNIQENSIETEQKKPKKKELSKLVGTFFRNALRSNLDLTSLADTKAGILISINGFILTVSVTASGFAIQNSMMTYAFISIILTSLGSIILAVLAVKPRNKNKLVDAAYLEGYDSLLYYQDMADLDPNEYKKAVNKVIYKTNKSKNEMISHLHILGAEIKKKYFWLTQAYTFFSVGLVISASFIIYALVYVEETAFYNLSKGNVVYKKDKFYNVFEPSGAATMPDGKVMIVEDEGNAKALKLLEIENNGKVSEIGNVYLRKKLKKVFKKSIEDLEAIAADGKHVYAITSHSLSKSNKSKSAREKFMMFEYADGTIEKFHIYANLKQDLINAFPDIFKKGMFFRTSLNIEGLAIDAKGVLIGFRSPTVGSKALLIGLKNPKKVLSMQEEPQFSKPILLNLNGLGIRDITYDKERKGYWIIAGGSNNREQKFELWFWDKAHNKLSAIKNQPDIGYGEGITIVKMLGGKPALFIVEDNGKKPNKSANYIIIQRNTL